MGRDRAGVGAYSVLAWYAQGWWAALEVGRSFSAWRWAVGGEEDGDLAATGYGDPACPLCGGPPCGRTRTEVDLIRLILLLSGLLRFGGADGWDVAWRAGVSLAWPGPQAVIEVRVDPVPIYYRPLPGDLCGLYDGVVRVDPDAPAKGCRETLAHELNHVWQGRTYGLLQPLTYALAPGLWEPARPWEGASGMPAPRTLNWALIRLYLPLYDPGR
ncbi:hypothetical protein [Thermus albus]|uniref:hypothetical protein n=1 Tax=Thermus albus TaxID=2908146 RepID=UPI001FAA5979|nr:hypothetical protein [Thermus albus]